MIPTETHLAHVPDTALLFEGGGYRASYTAGFASVLLEHKVQFDVVCGVSAGASHTVDYVSRDLKRIHDSFITLSDRKPQSGGIRSFLHGNGYFNADYDYMGCIEDNYMPFDWKAYCENPANVAIESFEADTGKSAVWTKKDMPTLRSMMEHVRASSTLPGMMNPIKINGHTMFDGGIGAGAGLPLQMVRDTGVKRVFVLATRPFGYRKKPVSRALKRLYARVSQGFKPLYQALVTRNERYNASLDRLRELVEQGIAYVVYPDEMPVKNTTNNRQKLEDSYIKGYTQGLNAWPTWQKWLFEA